MHYCFLVPCCLRLAGRKILQEKQKTQKNEQPVFYLSSDDIAENIGGRITYKYDAKYRMLSIYTGNEKNEEPAWQVCLQTEEEECGSRFESTGFGSHVYIEYKEGEFWIHGTLPLFFQGRAVEYGPTPGVSAPLTFSEVLESL